MSWQLYPQLVATYFHHHGLIIYHFWHVHLLNKLVCLDDS